MRSHRTHKQLSLRVQLMLWTSILALLLIVAVSVPVQLYLARSFGESRKSSLSAAKQNVLLITSSNLDFTFNASLDSNIMTEVIAPYTNRSRKQSMAQVALSQYTNNNLLTLEMSLYVPATKTVISSNYTTGHPAEEAFDYVQFYLDNDKSLDTISANGHLGRVFRCGGYLYMALDFPLSGDLRLGVLFARMDTDYLLRQLTEGAADNTLQLSGVHGGALLSSQNTELTLPDLTDVSDVITWSDRQYSYAATPIEDSTLYIASADTKTTGQLILELLMLIGPVTLFVILFCGIILYFMTERIFSPLENVHASFARIGRQNAGTSLGNIGDIELSVQELVEETQKQSEILHTVSNTLTEHLMVDLLSGEAHSARYYRQMFQKTNGPLSGAGNYCLLRLIPLRQEASIAAAISQCAAQEISDSQADFPFSDFSLFYRGELVYLLEFHKLLPILQVSSFFSQLKKRLAAATNPDCPFRVCGSQPYDKVEDTGFVYASMNTAKPDQLPVFRYTTQYFQKKLDDADALLQSGYPEDGIAFLTATLDSAYLDTDTLEGKQKVLRRFSTCLIDRLESSHIRIELQSFTDRNKAFLSSSAPDQLDQDLSAVHSLINGSCRKWAAYYQKRQNKYISKTLEYIDTHYADPALSLEAVAESLGIHFNYLSRIFKSGMEENFVSYVNRCRVDKSKALLASTDLTIGEIAARSGFGSQQNYAKVFKKYENMTPSQYRERKGEQP